MTRTITGTIGVYIDEHCGIDPKDLVSGKDETLLSGLRFTGFDMSDCWTVVGEAEITIKLRNVEEIISSRVSALQAKKSAVLAEAQNTATEIDRQIQSLLAITMK